MRLYLETCHQIVHAPDMMMNTQKTRTDGYLLLGKSLGKAVLVVVHTFKDADGTEFVRIISARKATKRERQIYHERCPK